MSTLLLAALCVLLAAPACQAQSQKYSHDSILSVLQESLGHNEVLAPHALPSRLSVLQIRKLRVALSQLDKSQLVDLQKHLAAHGDLVFEKPAPQHFPRFISHAKHFSPALQPRAQTSAPHTGRFLE